MKKFSLLLILFSNFATNVNADDTINIFVSILPQKYFVERVGGEFVNVNVMVGPGQNPATYEPTPQQIAALANAELYFSIGVPFENAWLEKIKQSNKQLIVVECCESISNLKGHTHDHSHEHEPTDPHVWTSPKKVIQLVELIKTSLTNIDEHLSEDFEIYANNFVRELSLLDELIKAKLSNLKNRNIIVSHPSWSYFANDYDLTQISIEQAGKEIQAKSMVSLIKLAKEKSIKAVFVQKQFNDKAAHIIANEINATVYELDPLAFNYIENMNTVTSRIIEGLSHD